jgi:predicted glycoside hydrolase/deacetylase ChbG (UPF0249 family)/SAM-dependent methyltransferase
MNARTYIAADDLGLTKGVTDSILQAADEGPVDRASVLADGAAIDYALREWQKRSGRLELGLHFNLTDGPLAEPRSFGRLLASSIFSRGAARATLGEHVRAELRRQTAIVRSVIGGTTPLGIDGHQHIHMIPLIVDEILALRDELGFSYIRVPLEPFYIARPYRAYFGAGALKHLVLNILSRRALPKIRQAAIRSNDFAAGILHTGMMSAAAAERALVAGRARYGAAAVAEVIFHPGVPEAEEEGLVARFPRSFRWSYAPQRREEAQTLARWKIAVRGARSWSDFWNEEHSIYASPRHMRAHYNAIARDVIALAAPHEKPLALLDYGCGDALSSPRLARAGMQVSLYDPAPAVRTRLKERFSAMHGISVLDEDPARSSGFRPDIILVNSVIQYLPKAEAAALLGRLGSIVAPGGSLILADVVPPGVGPLADAWSLMRGALRHGYPIAALRSLARTLASDYRDIRKREGFSTYSPKEMASILADAGWEAVRARKNVGLTPHRMTFVAKRGINQHHV